MPEYPEVHTVIKTLEEFVLNKKVVDTYVLRKKNVEGNLNELVGSIITHFSQIGKFIIFHFDNKKVLISHLRMEGKYFYRDINEAYSKHDIASLTMSDNHKLVYNDVRTFGILKVSD